MDQQKLEAFLGKAVSDLGATLSSAMVVLGDRLGLYKALAKDGPATPAELARRTKTTERHVREWLNNQAAGGYVTYDPKSGAYTLPPEQAFCLADEASPVFLPGGFQLALAANKSVKRIEQSFRDGKGMGWGEHDAELYEGTERFFRPSYVGNLVASWLPSLEGVVAKLEKGATVADVGCGHGASTILMGKSYPKSKFTGFDTHDPSVRTARERAKAAGVSANVSFETAPGTAFPGTYDLVTTFDCLHDMADPIGAAKATKKALKPGGTWMIVEPFAGDRPEENFNPVGRTYYGASSLVCVPCSLAGGGPAIGAQAGEARMREIVSGGGGFTRFRRAAQTPFNLVYEARP